MIRLGAFLIGRNLQECRRGRCFFVVGQYQSNTVAKADTLDPKEET